MPIIKPQVMRILASTRQNSTQFEMKRLERCDRVRSISLKLIYFEDLIFLNNLIYGVYSYGVLLYDNEGMHFIF